MEWTSLRGGPFIAGFNEEVGWPPSDVDFLVWLDSWVLGPFPALQYRDSLIGASSGHFKSHLFCVPLNELLRFSSQAIILWGPNGLSLAVVLPVYSSSGVIEV